MPVPNRSELALLRGKRTPESLEAWTAAFSEGDRELGKRYALALGTLLGGSPEPEAGEYTSYIGHLSPATRKAYAFAITEFFEWLATKRDRIVPPHKVTRKDVEDYANWLATRPFSLDAEKLKDGDQKERLAIYETVKALGAADITSIAAGLPAWLRKAHAVSPDSDRVSTIWLHHELGRMVLHDSLVRSPTMSELRREDPRIGIGVFTVSLPGQKAIPIEQVFQYQVPKPMAVARVTVAHRLAALAALWDVLAEGENVPGGQAIVQFNIFRPVLKRVQHGLSSEKREAAQKAGQLTPQIVHKLLAAADGPSLTEKRDAALLWFLVLTGARVTEVTRLRRDKPPASEENRWPGWLDPRGEPPTFHVVRKGGKRQKLPFPPYALKALAAFQATLAEHVPPPGAQSEDPHGKLYVPDTSARWRYKGLAEEPDAPLFPPVSFWGANSPVNYEEFKPNRKVRPSYRKPMSRHGVDALLKRVGRKAGLSDEDLAKVHGHALRHFAATAMERQGKSIRDIQAILGHESITTTERYFAEQTNPVALSGQNEILDYIAGGAVQEPPAPPEPPEARQPPARRPVVETYAVPQRPAAKAPKPAAPVALGPAEGLPAELPRVLPGPEVHKTAEGLIAVAPEEPAPIETMEVRDGLSPGAPYWVYDAMAPGAEAGEREREQDLLHFTMVNPRGTTTKERKLETLYVKGKREQVQQVKWLRENYDPWPLNYGLAESSLLPWYARGSASKNGEVKVEVRTKNGEKKLVVVPPLPVFAPSQLYPEVKSATFFPKVEALRQQWMIDSPTKAFGLQRWLGAFMEIHRGLSDGTHGKFRWAPFDALVKVGKQIRAHDDDFLVTWLEKNAERYTTTVRAFEGIQRPRGSAYDEEEWAAFSREFEKASHVGVSPAEELPDWFMLDDPIREIYDRDHEEWGWFSKWMGAVTGQKLTSVRKDEREAQKTFAATERETTIESARVLLHAYFETVEEVRRGASDARETLRLYTEELASLGIPDPAVAPGLPRSTEARIESILAAAFPEAGVELVDANVLHSQVFDAETFKLDGNKKTISHTAEFRKTFVARFDGRDSECVVRRAARAMWEHVKRHGIPIERGAKRSSEYSLLYSVMLSYMAWVVPCPPEIERRMARDTYLEGFRAASAKLARVDTDMDEATLLELVQQDGLDGEGAREVLEAALMQDSVRAEVALPSAPVAEALARSKVDAGRVEVRGVAGRKRVVVLEPGPRPTTYLSVGSEPEEGEELIPNAPPHRYMTPNAYARGLLHVNAAEVALPSSLRMMSAMTMRWA